MVSPYLMRPVRTLEQALRDHIRLRIRFEADTSARARGRMRSSPPAGMQVLMLPGPHVGPAANGRLAPPAPTDREAA